MRTEACRRGSGGHSKLSGLSIGLPAGRPSFGTLRASFFFIFKQKTAFEITRDWSSDVCSSDLDVEGFDRKRDGKDNNDVVDRIEMFERVLADGSQSKDVRAEALKFLVHFVGDVHQPLHCAEDRKSVV